MSFIDGTRVSRADGSLRVGGPDQPNATLSVTGVSTFGGVVQADSGLSVAGHANVDINGNAIVASLFTGGSVSAGSVTSASIVSGSATNGTVLETNGTTPLISAYHNGSMVLGFDGSNLAVSNNLVSINGGLIQGGTLQSTGPLLVGTTATVSGSASFAGNKCSISPAGMITSPYGIMANIITQCVNLTDTSINTSYGVMINQGQLTLQGIPEVAVNKLNVGPNGVTIAPDGANGLKIVNASGGYGTMNAGAYSVGGAPGVSGTVSNGTQTLTVNNGIITSIS